MMLISSMGATAATMLMMIALQGLKLSCILKTTATPGAVALLLAGKYPAKRRARTWR